MLNEKLMRNLIAYEKKESEYLKEKKNPNYNDILRISCPASKDAEEMGAKDPTFELPKYRESPQIIKGLSKYFEPDPDYCDWQGNNACNVQNSTSNTGIEKNFRTNTKSKYIITPQQRFHLDGPFLDMYREPELTARSPTDVLYSQSSREPSQQGSAQARSERFHMYNKSDVSSYCREDSYDVRQVAGGSPMGKNAEQREPIFLATPFSGYNRNLTDSYTQCSSSDEGIQSPAEQRDPIFHTPPFRVNISNNRFDKIKKNRKSDITEVLNKSSEESVLSETNLCDYGSFKSDKKKKVSTPTSISQLSSRCSTDLDIELPAEKREPKFYAPIFRTDYDSIKSSDNQVSSNNDSSSTLIETSAEQREPMFYTPPFRVDNCGSPDSRIVLDNVLNELDKKKSDTKALGNRSEKSILSDSNMHARICAEKKPLAEQQGPKLLSQSFKADHGSFKRTAHEKKNVSLPIYLRPTASFYRHNASDVEEACNKTAEEIPDLNDSLMLKNLYSIICQKKDQLLNIMQLVLGDHLRCEGLGSTQPRDPNDNLILLKLDKRVMDVYLEIDQLLDNIEHSLEDQLRREGLKLKEPPDADGRLMLKTLYKRVYDEMEQLNNDIVRFVDDHLRRERLQVKQPPDPNDNLMLKKLYSRTCDKKDQLLDIIELVLDNHLRREKLEGTQPRDLNDSLILANLYTRAYDAYDEMNQLLDIIEDHLRRGGPPDADDSVINTLYTRAYDKMEQLHEDITRFVNDHLRRERLEVKQPPDPNESLMLEILYTRLYDEMELLYDDIARILDDHLGREGVEGKQPPDPNFTLMLKNLDKRVYHEMNQLYDLLIRALKYQLRRQRLEDKQPPAEQGSPQNSTIYIQLPSNDNTSNRSKPNSNNQPYSNQLYSHQEIERRLMPLPSLGVPSSNNRLPREECDSNDFPVQDCIDACLKRYTQKGVPPYESSGDNGSFKVTFKSEACVKIDNCLMKCFKSSNSNNQ